MAYKSTSIWECLVTLVAFIWFLSSVYHQMLLKATISQKKVPTHLYCFSPTTGSKSHNKQFVVFLPQKWHFWFLIIETKNPLLWNCHISMELIWNISVHLYDFLQYVSSDAITDHIYVRKLSQWLHLYGFSPVMHANMASLQCGILYGFSPVIHANMASLQCGILMLISQNCIYMASLQ